jgi:hypothetical protein
VTGFSDGPKALDAVLPLVEDELSRTETEGITDTHRIAQAVRWVMGKRVGETYRRRPMIVPTVIRRESGCAGPKSRLHEVRWYFPADGLFM